MKSVLNKVSEGTLQFLDPLEGTSAASVIVVFELHVENGPTAHLVIKLHVPCLKKSWEKSYYLWTVEQGFRTRSLDFTPVKPSESQSSTQSWSSSSSP